MSGPHPSGGSRGSGECAQNSVEPAVPRRPLSSSGRGHRHNPSYNPPIYQHGRALSLDLESQQFHDIQSQRKLQQNRLGIHVNAPSISISHERNQSTGEFYFPQSPRQSSESSHDAFPSFDQLLDAPPPHTRQSSRAHSRQGSIAKASARSRHRERPLSVDLSRSIHLPVNEAPYDNRGLQRRSKDLRRLSSRSSYRPSEHPNNGHEDNIGAPGPLVWNSNVEDRSMFEPGAVYIEPPSASAPATAPLPPPQTALRGPRKVLKRRNAPSVNLHIPSSFDNTTSYPEIGLGINIPGSGLAGPSNDRMHIPGNDHLTTDPTHSGLYAPMTTRATPHKVSHEPPTHGMEYQAGGTYMPPDHIQRPDLYPAYPLQSPQGNSSQAYVGNQTVQPPLGGGVPPPGSASNYHNPEWTLWDQPSASYLPPYVPYSEVVQQQRHRQSQFKEGARNLDMEENHHLSQFPDNSRRAYWNELDSQPGMNPPLPEDEFSVNVTGHTQAGLPRSSFYQHRRSGMPVLNDEQIMENDRNLQSSMPSSNTADGYLKSAPLFLPSVMEPIYPLPGSSQTLPFSPSFDSTIPLQAPEFPPGPLADSFEYLRGADDLAVTVPGDNYSEAAITAEWDDESVDELLKLLEAGERYKWKYVSDVLSQRQNKRIPLRACKSKFEAMFGETEASSLLRSSLFYVAYRSGWDTINSVRTEQERIQDNETHTDGAESQKTQPSLHPNEVDGEVPQVKAEITEEAPPTHAHTNEEKPAESPTTPS